MNFWSITPYMYVMRIHESQFLTLNWIIRSIRVSTVSELSPHLNCRHIKQGLEIKSHHGDILRKYGICNIFIIRMLCMSHFLHSFNNKPIVCMYNACVHMYIHVHVAGDSCGKILRAALLEWVGRNMWQDFEEIWYLSNKEVTLQCTYIYQEMKSIKFGCRCSFSYAPSHVIP